VRLLKIQIEDFRSIYDQSLPADGLVVLFGPNSAGKTSVLEAATELIRTSATHRSDPGKLEDVFALGSLRFDLPGAGTAGSPDAEIYRSLLCGEYTDGWAWDWLGQGTAELLKGARLDEARTYLADRLIQLGQVGEPGDREVLARANRVAPQFVKDQGTIGIEVVPVSVWSPDRPRVRATFTAHDGERRDLKVIGAGTARWAAAAVRLACRRLEAGRQVVTDKSGDETRNHETIQESSPWPARSLWPKPACGSSHRTPPLSTSPTSQKCTCTRQPSHRSATG
jgi:hypothetical protein